MRLRLLRAAGALTFLALSLCPLTALAHEEITVGNYVIEYGWQEEPPVAGRPNAIVLAIGGAEGEHSDEGLSGQIHLVAPADGSTVSGDTLEVTIRVEGIDEHDAESLHWDLTVDEREVAMAPLTQT